MALQTIAAGKAREKFHELVRGIGSEPEQYIITREGRPAAVLLNYEEYQKMMETIYGARVPGKEVHKDRRKK